MAGLRVSKNGSDPNYLFGMAGGFEFAKLVRIRAIFSGWQGAPSSQKWFGSELFFRDGRGLRVRKNGSDPNYLFGMAGGFEFAKLVRIRTIFSEWFRNGRGLRVRKIGSDPNYLFGMAGASSSQNWFGSELSFRDGRGPRGGKNGSDPSMIDHISESARPPFACCRCERAGRSVSSNNPRTTTVRAVGDAHAHSNTTGGVAPGSASRTARRDAEGYAAARRHT